MNSVTIRAAVAAAFLAVLVLVTAWPVQGQAGAGIRVYGGETVQGSAIEVAPWGSGEVREAEEESFAGVRSLQLTTHGPAQGLRIILKSPVDLAAAAADPSIYLRIGVKLGFAQSPGTAGYYGAQGGGYYEEDGRGGGMRRGGGRASSYGAGGQYGRSADQSIRVARPITAVRVVLVMTDGKQCERLFPLANASNQRDEWRVVAAPVPKIPGIAATNLQLKEVRLFADSVGVLYIGDVSTVHDVTPINLGDLPEQTVAVNDVVTFSGSADAGNTQLKYEWTVVREDEGSVPKGLPSLPDMEGRTVRYFFRKSGDYVVTLKLSDVDGVKKPVTTQTKVTVTL